jgi:hypothetical protein
MFSRGNINMKRTIMVPKTTNVTFEDKRNHFIYSFKAKTRVTSVCGL